MARDDQHPPRIDPRVEEPRPVRRPPAPPEAGGDHRSLGDLLRELVAETRTLVRQEIQLAKTEATDVAKKAGKNAGLIAAGGFIAYAGFIALVMALGLLLGTFMPDWLGFLIAGLIVVLTGAALLQKGRKGLKHTDFSLDRTAETLQEDKQWIKQEAQEVKDDPKHLGADR